MRTSNKLLIGFGAFVLLLTVIGLVAGRLVIDFITTHEPEIMVDFTSNGEHFESTLELENPDAIDTLKISGRWNMIIVEGPGRLEMNSYRDKGILKEASINGNVIVLRSDENTDAAINAVLSLPDPGKLRKIDDWGLGRLEINDCDGDVITVDIKGDQKIDLIDSSWKMFELDGMGSISLQSSDSEISSLDVNLAGVIDADIVISDGGKIEGEVAGTGSVKYSGNNVKEDFNFLGPGRIIRK